MRPVVSVILLAVFGLPSLLGVGLHGLMPHGVDPSQHHAICHIDRLAAPSGTCCDHDHDPHDSMETITSHSCHGCEDGDCAICLFCMAHKPAYLTTSPYFFSLFVVVESFPPDSFVSFTRIFAPVQRGPPVA